MATSERDILRTELRWGAVMVALVVVIASALSDDEQRGIDLRQQLGLSAKFAHRGAGRNKESVFTDGLDIIGRNLGLSAVTARALSANVV